MNPALRSLPAFGLRRAAAFAIQGASAAVLAHGAAQASYAWAVGASVSGDLAAWAGEVALNGSILALAWAACLRALPISLMFPLLAAAHLLSEGAVFVDTVHPLLERHGLYPPFLVNPATGLANPQSAVVLAFLLAAAAAACRAAIPSGRSFDRMAALVMAVAVAVTGTMFHATTVLSVQRQRAHETELLRAVAASGPDLRACDLLRLKCLPSAPGKLPDTGAPSLDLQAADVARFAFEHPDGAFFHAWSGASASDRGIGNNYVAAISRPVPGGSTFLIASFDRPGERMDFEQARFSLHTAAAHLVWLIGTFATCWIHSSRRRAWKAMKLADAAVAAGQRRV